MPILKDETRKWEKSALLSALEAAQVPASPINSVGEVFDDPQVVARGMRIEPDGVPGVRSPIVFGRSRLDLERTAPRLGEHNAAIRQHGWDETGG